MTRRRAIWLVAAAALVGVVAFVFWPTSEKPFYDYLDERRAAGLPTTRDDVRGPAPLASENGAEDLRGAWEGLVAAWGPESSWTATAFDESLALGDGGWPDGLTDDQRAALAKTAERLRPGIEPLVRALEKPRLVFLVTFDGDGARIDSHVTLLSNANRAVQIQAAGDADPARRLAACRAILLLAERSECGAWIDWMVGQSARTSGIATLRSDVESGRIDAGAARAACDGLLRTSVLAAFRTTGTAEVVELLENYRAVVEGRCVTSTAKLSGWKRIEHRFDMARRRLAGTAGPFDVDFEPGIADLVVAVCRLRDAAARAPDLRTLTTADGLAAIDPTGLLRAPGSKDLTVRLVHTALRTEAAARLARVALAAADLRATHGDFPASLDELRPMFPDGVPLDPYTDAPFVYERTAAGVRIASAGRLAGEDALDEATLRAQCLSWELRR